MQIVWLGWLLSFLRSKDRCVTHKFKNGGILICSIAVMRAVSAASVCLHNPEGLPVFLIIVRDGMFPILTDCGLQRRKSESLGFGPRVNNFSVTLVEHSPWKAFLYKCEQGRVLCGSIGPVRKRNLSKHLMIIGANATGPSLSMQITGCFSVYRIMVVLIKQDGTIACMRGRLMVLLNKSVNSAAHTPSAHPGMLCGLEALYVLIFLRASVYVTLSGGPLCICGCCGLWFCSNQA